MAQFMVAVAAKPIEDETYTGLNSVINVHGTGPIPTANKATWLKIDSTIKSLMLQTYPVVNKTAKAQAPA